MDICSILKQYDEGKAYTAIAKEAGRCSSTIKKILIKNGRKIRNLSESHQIFYFDETFFKKIDTEAKAYILGFIYADGNVHKNVFQICLHSKDIEILEMIKTQMKSEHYIVDDRGYKRFRIGNQKLIQDLQKLGVVERKTFTLKFPSEEIVPKELIRHFMRGYFDGDGCVGYTVSKKWKSIGWKFEIISCFDFICEYARFLREGAEIHETSLSQESRRANPIFYMKYGGTAPDTINKIYNFLYKDATFFLTRKKLKFEHIFNKINEFRNEPCRILRLQKSNRSWASTAFNQN